MAEAALAEAPAAAQAELERLRRALAAAEARAELARAELARERRERGEWMGRKQHELQEQLHLVYRAEIADLKAKLTAEREARRAETAELRAEAAALKKACEAKLREMAAELAMYKESGPARNRSDKVGGTDLDEKKKKKDKRKRKPRGGGRNIPKNLPAETVVHELAQRTCPDCGKPLPEAQPETAHEVDFEIRIRLLRHEREKRAGCACGWRSDGAPFAVAPLPPKAMAGSLFADRAWIETFLLKYGHGLPLNQVREMFRAAGCPVHCGTLCDGLARFADRILAPLDRAIIEHNLASPWWGADESSLRIVAPEADRTHGVVWQIRGPDSTVFMCTPTGEAHHIQTYFADRLDGLLLADRALTFQTLWFIVAFCWAHVRRDFVRLGRYVHGNRTFALRWLALIRRLYRLHRAWNSADADAADACRAEIAAHLELMAAERDAELARPDLPEPRRKVLRSLAKHWPGLVRFLDHPELPLDNNDVERDFRPLARLRRNSQAVHSQAGADVAMRAFTVLRTLEQNGVPAKPYLLAWTAAVAENHGRPPDDLDAWLPWSLSDEVRRRIEHARAP